MRLVRFIIDHSDVASGRRQGLFQALAELDGRGELSPDERRIYVDTYEWFRKNLPEPLTFTRSSKPHAKRVAISWFKDSAAHHIERMRLLAAIAESHGVAVKMIRTDRPGYVVYEDQWQVTAEPFNDTGA